MTCQNIWYISFNSLWPSDAIWRHISGSTLAQVMACCLTAPSHYLNQCWLIISEVRWQSPGDNSTKSTPAFISWKVTYLNFHSNLPGVNKLIVYCCAVHWDRYKWPPFCRLHLRFFAFVYEHVCCFLFEFHWKVFTKRQLTDNGFIIIWTHDGIDYWRFYVSHGLNELTYCGLVTPYGDRDLGQHWLR